MNDSITDVMGMPFDVRRNRHLDCNVSRLNSLGPINHLFEDTI